MSDAKHEPATSVAAGLQRLQWAAARGRFDDSGFALVVVHGSAARGQDEPGDLDVAIRFDRDRIDLVGVVGLLADIVAPLTSDRLDVMDLARAGTLATARALEAGCLPLHEDIPGRFAEAQTIALARYLDDQWLRDALLASLQPAGS